MVFAVTASALDMPTVEYLDNSQTYGFGLPGNTDIVRYWDCSKQVSSTCQTMVYGRLSQRCYIGHSPNINTPHRTLVLLDIVLVHSPLPTVLPIDRNAPTQWQV